MVRTGFATAVVAWATLGPVASAQDGREALVGLYRSPLQAQPAPGGATAFIKAEFSFDGERNAVTVETFNDESQSQPLFTYRSFGTIDVEGPSVTMPGAWNVQSRNEVSTVEVFADVPGLWQGLGLGSCPLKIGAAIDISQCVSGGPFHIAGCVESDVLWLSPDKQAFRTGGGEANRCKERPTELGEVDFRRVG